MNAITHSVPGDAPRSHAPPGLTLALELAAAGWHVLPLSPSSKRPLANCPGCQEGTRCALDAIEACPCIPAGKWCHGVRAATTNSLRLSAWWKAEPAAVPGVAAGPSGLVLIDIDTHTDELPASPATALLPGIDLTAETRAGNITEAMWRDNPAGQPIRDGRDTLRLLTTLRGGTVPWPPGPACQPIVAATPSGGRHLWYRAPTDDLRQAISELGWQIDIKAGWNYGIAPGAHTRKGTYEVLAGNVREPGDMPGWLAREVIRVASRRTTPSLPQQIPQPAPAADHSRAASYLTAVIANGARELASLGDGRKRALAALAYKTGGYLAWSGLPRTQVTAMLIQAGLASGLSERTARRSVERSLANGIRNPLPEPRSNRAA